MEMSPGFGAPLFHCKWQTDTRLLESLNYRISTPKYYGQMWHRKVAYLSIYTVFWTGVLRWKFGSHSLETGSSLRTAAKTNSVQRFHSILQHRNREGFWSVSKTHHTDDRYLASYHARLSPRLFVTAPTSSLL